MGNALNIISSFYVKSDFIGHITKCIMHWIFMVPNKLVYYEFSLPALFRLLRTNLKG